MARQRDTAESAAAPTDGQRWGAFRASCSTRACSGLVSSMLRGSGRCVVASSSSTRNVTCSAEGVRFSVEAEMCGGGVCGRGAEVPGECRMLRERVCVWWGGGLKVGNVAGRAGMRLT
eukprot:248014-Chlamydomonas_euryale.AAC.1